MLNKTKELLNHIQDEVTYLSKISKTVKSEKDIIKDQTLKRAITRSLEIIGEATKKIPTSFTLKHSHIEWRSMAGMRDKLIHDYFDIDYEIVWDVLKNKIPDLKNEIKDLIKQL